VRYLLLFLQLFHDRLGRQLGLNSSDFSSELLKKILKDKKTPVIFDVGANVGEFTRKVFGAWPAARVLVFEPQGELESHFLEFAHLDLQFIALALGKLESELHFQRNSIGDRKAHISTSDLGYTIDVSTVDAQILRCEVSKIDLLKIDTEGNDFDVLLGARDSLSSGKIDLILFEIMPRMLIQGTFPSEAEEYLRSFGFKFFYRTTPHLGLLPLNKLVNFRLETQNIFASRYAL
jgi:FkbM family methyltransferase